MRSWFTFGVLIIAACGCSSMKHSNMQDSLHIREGFVSIENGALYYEEMGSGRPLILLHGGLLDRRMWDAQVEEFAEHFRVIRFDARGHGRSSAMADTFSRYNDLAQLMDALMIDEAILVGLSMGAYTGIDFSLSYPTRVTSLVLVSPGLTGYKHTTKILEENNQRLVAAIKEGDIPKAVEFFQRSWTDGPHRTPSQVDSAIRNRVRALVMDTATDYNFANLEKRLTPPAIDRLTAITTPTLVIVGTLDMPGVIEISQMIERQVAGSQVVRIEGAAHMVSMERSDAFNRAVLRFLSAFR